MNKSKIYKYLSNKMDELLNKHNCTVDYNLVCTLNPNPTMEELKTKIKKLEDKIK